CRSVVCCIILFFFSSRRRHTSFSRDWSSDVCSSDLRVCRLLSDCPHAPTAPYLDQARPLLEQDHELSLTQNFRRLLRGGNARWRSEERRVGKECKSGGES